MGFERLAGYVEIARSNRRCFGFVRPAMAGRRGGLSLNMTSAVLMGGE